MIISLIAAMSRNRVIGKNNDLPWKLPTDFKYFKQKTMGHIIIMGRKNYDAMGKALPGRENLVLSRTPGLTLPDAKVFADLQQALDYARGRGETECFIIGGEQIYRLAMPLASRIYLTRIDAFVEGDTFFPEWPDREFKETLNYPGPEGETYRYAWTILDRVR